LTEQPPPPHSSSDVKYEYEQRRKSRAFWLAQEEALSRRIWILRRVVFAAGAVIILAAIYRIIPFWTPAIPVAAFLALMIWHQRVLARCLTAGRSVDFYERGIARIEDRWAGSGESGERFSDKAHPYSEDLDLFGRGSLFELLSSARTHAGQDRLASWLLAPTGIDEIRLRQDAVRELRPLIDLREELALLGAGARDGVDSGSLLEWIGEAPIYFSTALKWIAAVLGVATAVVILVWLQFGGRSLVLAAVVAEAVFLLITRERVGKVMSSVERPARDLRLLSAILARLEREQFSTTKLATLRAALDTTGKSASRQIARLYLLIDILDSTRNLFFGPLAMVLLIPPQLAMAIEHWRQGSANAVAQWLDAISEIEALASLAGYSAEHPADPFPELVESETCLDGTLLSHPLLNAARAVPNSVRLGPEQRVLIVSGSNMSGKSTLLRTVGINAVLALAGAPVRAQSMRLSLLSIGASIHILDSLQEGSSRFYAEITRLQGIVEITGGKHSLLFLLDEILSGTNSHDRQIGAAAVVSGLVKRGSVGMITTHDLALTKIADDPSIMAVNVHFEDRIEDGRIEFDYAMRPGVVTRSNALELMRAVGLDV
jgi:hypothetical protein